MAQDSSSINSLINLGIPQDAPDSIKNPEVRSIYYTFMQSINNLIRYVEQYCGVTQKDITQWSSLTPSDTILPQNLRRLYVKANVALSYGHFVNLYDSGTALEARKADSGIPLVAHGYVNVATGAAAGDMTEVIVMEGLVTIAGVVRGTSYFLAPNGLVANAPGVKKQFIGFGVATNLLAVCIDRSAF